MLYSMDWGPGTLHIKFTYIVPKSFEVCVLILYSHFIDDETETQIVSVICPRSWSQEVIALRTELRVI